MTRVLGQKATNLQIQPWNAYRVTQPSEDKGWDRLLMEILNESLSEKTQFNKDLEDPRGPRGPNLFLGRQFQRPRQ